MLKYTKSTIEGKDYKKEYNVLIIQPNAKDFKPLKIHLLVFELETNNDELKSGLIRVEGWKDFLENEVKLLIKDTRKWEMAKLEIKKMMLFDKIWMKLS